MKKYTSSTRNFRQVAFALLLLQIVFISCSNKSNSESGEKVNYTKIVPIGSNSWAIGDDAQYAQTISKKGIQNWTSLDEIIHTYVRTGKGDLKIGLKIKSPDGASKINVSINGKTKTVNIANKEYEVINVGSFNVTEGYVKIEIKGIQKKGATVAAMSEILFAGSAVTSIFNFVPLSNDHFGRRGPSVHMTYKLPENKNVQWFYNEITVPEGEDKLGSFFMANGHSNGYFGMQVNSSSERRVLFSIWSSYVTDDPDQIPKDYTVSNLGNGEGVTVKNFGGEGSGIQSFKNANWKAGVTYKFLLKGEPSSVKGSTDYTGYFFDPEKEKWELIASLRRPKTVTYIKRTHSFLENFIPNEGNVTRKVNFGNQWVYTTDGNWIELTKGNFTVDSTASREERLDYAGGVEDNTFFLKNCGFFNENVKPKTSFTRKTNKKSPKIDFSKLPKPVL